MTEDGTKKENEKTWNNKNNTGHLSKTTPFILVIKKLHTVFLRHFEVRWIVQESPIYHRVDKSLFYQNPLSLNSAKFSFFRYTT